MSYKLGIFSWYGYNTHLKKRLKLIKETGFDSTMIWWGDEKAFEDLKPEKIVEVCKDIGLEIENIHVPFDECNKIWSSDKKEREYIISKYKEWINDCRKFNIPVLVMHLSKGYEVKKFNKYGLDSIEETAAYAEKKRVKIALENTRNNILLYELFSRINMEYLGLCFDSSHAWLYEKEENEILKKLGSKIIAMHLSDNDKKVDRHWLKEDGLNNWEPMLKYLPKEIVNISLEVYPKEKISEELFLKKAFKMADEIKEKLKL